MNHTGYCIFTDTICQGRIPAWHDEKGFPVIYPNVEAAQREIAEDVIEYLHQFLKGDRSFEEAMTVEDYILPVNIFPDGTIIDLEGNKFRKQDAD